MDNGQLIEWDDRYSVGIELIDEQHRELASQMNNLWLGCQKGGQEEKFFFDVNIQPLLRYMSYHFSSEERMLERIKYPDLAAHVQQHSDMMRIIAEGVGHIQQEEPSALLSGNRLSDFAAHLRDTLISHIIVMDKKYVSYIHFVNRKLGTYVMETTLPTELFIG
ncbi:MAG: bacteriohemerythrin [Treponema sp.]|jgi:hemerythrin-like metal-binding protein|nr:bacteriohemerythrin [Treponema sp.]